MLPIFVWPRQTGIQFLPIDHVAFSLKYILTLQELQKIVISLSLLIKCCLQFCLLIFLSPTIDSLMYNNPRFPLHTCRWWWKGCPWTVTARRRQILKSPSPFPSRLCASPLPLSGTSPGTVGVSLGEPMGVVGCYISHSVGGRVL